MGGKGGLYYKCVWQALLIDRPSNFEQSSTMKPFALMQNIDEHMWYRALYEHMIKHDNIW